MQFTDYQIYHIFTMGFCGAEEFQDQCEGTHHRLDKVEKMTSYIKGLGMNAVLFGPLFSSVSHGYDTTDYKNVDPRLGTNEDLKALVDSLHQNGIKVVLDCVFNHVGREFWAFKDLQENRENARYKDWFSGVNFWDNNGYNDGFRYDNWAGCDNLVKLNLYNGEVRQYLKEVVAFWIETFDIDGLRMDAANVMDLGFLREFSDHVKGLKSDFLLLGECVHADYYSRLVHEGGLDSVTNYEDYKGMYSSLKEKNYFEIAYSLNRLFAGGGLLGDVPTANFVDNHDVDRVASTLDDDSLLEPLYLMLFTMPGFPTVYYGSEQGAKARKGQGTDAPLRPCCESMHFDPQTVLYKQIARMATIRQVLTPLKNGNYEQLFVASCQMGYSRECDGQRVMIVFNCDHSSVDVSNSAFNGKFEDVYHDNSYDLNGSITIPANSGMILVPSDLAQTLEFKNDDCTDAVVEEPRHIGKSESESSNNMHDYMEMALSEARQAADEGEVPVGAIVMCDGVVVGRGHNKKEGLKDPTAHAEILAIREASKKLDDWRLDQCELYVTAEPCPMCMGAVIQSRIKKVVYGTYEPRFGSIETTAELGKHAMLPKNMEFYGGICEDECQTLLKSFFEKTRQ